MPAAGPATEVASPRLRLTDLHGGARLLVDATIGVVDLVEAMHHTIASRTGILGAAPAGGTSGITGFVYRTIRGTARLAGAGMDAAWNAGWDGVAPELVAAAPAREREAVLAALNGVFGDHLAASFNKLAIKMRLRAGGVPLALDAAGLRARIAAPQPHVVVLVHGLCMNDLQWTRQEHDHGTALARDLPASAVYLHYNTGRHVSENGRDFAALLESLVANWPVPVTDLTIIGHSMGGLVARSACVAAAESGAAWLGRLNRIVFLGTPHHGAALERGGLMIDKALQVSPYIAPFARLGRARSAGITDLRFGNVVDADWQGRDRHSQTRDDRQAVKLPAHVDAFIVAATQSDTAAGLRGLLLGDGLVPLRSALGEHDDPEKALGVPAERVFVAAKAGHFELLSRGDVYERVVGWLR